METPISSTSAPAGRTANRAELRLTSTVARSVQSRAKQQDVSAAELAQEVLKHHPEYADGRAKDAVNALQWCKALLNAESPQAPAVVQRFEADLKCFRCSLVVLLVLLAAWLFQQGWPPAGIPAVLGLLLLAPWRFKDHRDQGHRARLHVHRTATAKNCKIDIERPAEWAAVFPQEASYGEA